MSRVVVTGLGLHGAAGDLAATWQSLAEGRGHVRPFSLPAAVGMEAVPGCPAAPVDLSTVLSDRKLRKYMNGATEMAVLAAGRALSDGGLLGDGARCADTSLFLSTGLIPFDLTEALPVLLAEMKSAAGQSGEFALTANTFRRCNPLLPFKMLLNMPLGLVSIVFGLQGENAISYPAGQQSAVALDVVRRGIASGRFRRALVGGSAQQLSLGPLLSAARSGHLARTPEEADPSGPKHRGTSLADTAACLVVESDAEANRRAAHLRAELEGAASLPPSPARGELTSSLLEELLEGFAAPDVCLVTGLRNATEFGRLRESARRWNDAMAIATFDGRLGFGGAAALASSMALACQLFDGGIPPGTLLGDRRPEQLERVLVLSQDLDGSLGAALLRAPEARS